MTWFINVRATDTGGIESAEARLWTEAGQPADQSGARRDFVQAIRGRHVVLASHGFNVSQQRGIASLDGWSRACSFPGHAVFVGLLWPGDSAFLPVLDYPAEGQEAMRSAPVLARFINDAMAPAAAVSFVSHSLGARFVLEAARHMDRSPARLVLMAGAIEDDCLTGEYAEVAQKAGRIHVLASRRDWVLAFAFPIGNPVGEIIMHGHPYFRQALGREGPAEGFPPGTPGDLCQIPDGWDYGHLDYLPGGPVAPFSPPVAGIPPPDEPVPSGAASGWKPSWSAGMLSFELVP